MNRPYFYYRAFGLTFKSCVEHYDLVSVPETANPDCTIDFGSVPEQLEDPKITGGVFQSRNKTFLLVIENVGRFLVENGNTITIDKIPSASIKEIVVFLWASAVAALLHQRDMMVLHGSAVQRNGKAIIFSGSSGSGKSTIAASMSARDNSTILSDDISVIVHREHSRPVVQPGYPIIKLWRDSTETLGVSWNDDMRIRGNVNKMMMNMEHQFHREPCALSQIYLLLYKNSGPVTVTEVQGFRKLELVAGKVFRKNYLEKSRSNSSRIFNDVAAILPDVRLCVVERQHGLAWLPETIGAIESDYNLATQCTTGV